jgi:HSP20 family molecular chaperone IbpA
MRYRRLSYRYTMVVGSDASWPLAELWPSDRVRLFMHGRWRPEADAYETEETVEVVVELAGVDEDDFEVQLFEDVLVIEGTRRLPCCEQTAVYHMAGIRQGPFRLELRLPAPIDHERVDARYERGLLHVTLPKRATG